MTDSDEDFTPKWPRLLRNRFVVVPALLLLLTAGWNTWVVTHDHGLVAGRVLTHQRHAGPKAPRSSCEVFNFATFVVTASTTTKPDGSFTFENNPSHNIQVSAEKPGQGRSAADFRPALLAARRIFA